jgi:hypothetical protein
MFVSRETVRAIVVRMFRCSTWEEHFFSDLRKCRRADIWDE